MSSKNCLTKDDLKILKIIKDNPSANEISEISKLHRKSKQSVTRSVHRLLKSGCIKPHTNDEKESSEISRYSVTLNGVAKIIMEDQKMLEKNQISSWSNSKSYSSGEQVKNPDGRICTRSK